MKDAFENHNFCNGVEFHRLDRIQKASHQLAVSISVQHNFKLLLSYSTSWKHLSRFIMMELFGYHSQRPDDDVEIGR